MTRRSQRKNSKSLSETDYINFLRKDSDSMKSSIIKTKDELPMFMSVPDMIALLGLSRTKAYELVGKEGFPKLNIVPGRIIIPRDKLFVWLDENTIYTTI